MRKAALLNWLVYRMTKITRQRARTPRWRIGIYKVDRLGDFVLALGAIRAITEIAGEENCLLFHGAAASELAHREFPRLAKIEVPPLDGKLWVARQSLEDVMSEDAVADGVDQLICLRHFRALFDEVALQMIPASEVWAVRNSAAGKLGYEFVRNRFEGDVIVERPSPESGESLCEDLRCHEALLRRWAGFFLAGHNLRPRLERPARPRRATLALAPFGSDRLRDLPPRIVAACAIHASYVQGLESVLLSPPNAVPRYEAYARQLAEHGAQASIQVTRTSEDLIDAIRSSAALLTTETATAHLAAALDHPMVCLLGGGHYGYFAPWRRSGRQIWVSCSLPCFNCNWECIHPEPYCVTRVEAQHLTNALNQVLELRAATTEQANA
jgi:ADP-heptose:LPS heptosyltransferase